MQGLWRTDGRSLGFTGRVWAKRLQWAGGRQRGAPSGISRLSTGGLETKEDRAASSAP